MLAGKHTLPAILHGIECFRSQTYPFKELIIVNNCRTQWEASGFNIKAESDIFIIDTPQLVSAGMARNYGISASNGQILAQFDANHWHNKRRLEIQIATLAHAQAHIAVLSRTMCYSSNSCAATYYTNPKSAILSSMVFARPHGIDYPDWDKNEEYGILSRMQTANMRIASINKPEMMCRLHLAGTEYQIEQSEVTKQHTKVIQSILKNYPK